MRGMRTIVPVAAAAAFALITACGSSNGPSATIVSMEVTVGDETVTMDADGTVTGSFTVSGGESLSTAFFDADSVAVTVSGADFALALAPADTNRLQYEPLAPFSGVLQGLVTGATSVSVSVLEVVSTDIVFGPFTVPVTVQ